MLTIIQCTRLCQSDLTYPCQVLPEWSNAAIAMSAGLLFGLITMLVQYVGLFMLGFHTGRSHIDRIVGDSLIITKITEIL